MWHLSEQQAELSERVRDIAMAKIRHRVLEVPDCCDYPADLFAVLADEKLLGLEVPVIAAAAVVRIVQTAGEHHAREQAARNAATPHPTTTQRGAGVQDVLRC